MAASSDSFKAGLFVVIGLVLGFVVVIMLSDVKSFFTGTQQVTVRFSLQDGLQGLREGAMVTIGNYPVGSVKSIRDDVRDGIVVGKLAVVEIPDTYQLYDNAQIELVVPPLGSGTAMNIRSVGFDATPQERRAIIIQGWRVIHVDDEGMPINIPADLAGHYTPAQIKAEGVPAIVDASGRPKLGDSWEYEAGEIIRGGVAASPLIVDLVAEMGIGDVQRQQLREIIGNFHAISEQLAKDPERYDKLMTDVGKLAGDAQAVMGEFRQRSEVWWDRFDSITGTVDKGADLLKSALGEADAILKENRPTIRDGLEYAKDALGKADEIMARVRDDTLEKIDTALDKAGSAVDEAKDLLAELNTMVVTQRPVLERMLANMRLSSDQLKLATIEIRRSPWRLLYKPTDAELEVDNLYDAARSFALAAASLESTAESLEALVKKQDGVIPTDDRNLRLMLDNLHRIFEQYSEAETKFWKVLNDKIKK